MNRRRFLTGLTLGTLTAPLAAVGQQAVRTPRIGVLTIARYRDDRVERNFEALRQGLRERGWTDGQNIGFEYRWADGKYERLPYLAAELVSAKVDVILGATTPLIRAVKDATKPNSHRHGGHHRPSGRRFCR